MFVTTFYSFKGGVGRTQAVVETATQLALAGKKVLLVDFDLEAPGLDRVLATQPHKGLVDFIFQYKKTGEVPDASKYIVSRKLKKKNLQIQLDLMPAGLQTDGYGSQLESINWKALYDVSDGFLLIEDLRQQWKTLEYDYVLIDSRTGHTDAGGICTRQLPNSLVAVAFPNEQNLVGLKTIVSRAVDSGGHYLNRDTLPVHFVLSRIPTCDDENGILEKRIKTFLSEISFETEHRIYHYDSMDLLDHVIFSLSRPKTKLALAYKELTDAVRSRNIHDREGVLTRLHGQEEAVSIHLLNAEKSTQIDTNWVDQLMSIYEKDDEILFYAGLYLFKNQRYQRSLDFLYASSNIDRGNTASMVIAVVLMIQGKKDAAVAQVLESFKHPRRVPNILNGFQILSDASSEIPEDIGTLKAFKLLSPKHWEELVLKAEKTEESTTIRHHVFKHASFDGLELPNVKVSHLLLNLVSALLPELAMSLINSLPEEQFDQLSNEDPFLFNYMICKWLVTGQPDPTLANVLERNSIISTQDPNHPQCYALLAWLNGKFERAMELVQMSRDIVEASGPVSNFSCWSYSLLSKSAFLGDLLQMERGISGREAPSPKVLHLYHSIAGQHAPKKKRN